MGNFVLLQQQVKRTTLPKNIITTYLLIIFNKKSKNNGIMLIKSKFLNNNFYKCIKTLLDTCQLSYFSNTKFNFKIRTFKGPIKKIGNVLLSVV